MLLKDEIQRLVIVQAHAMRCLPHPLKLLQMVERSEGKCHLPYHGRLITAEEEGGDSAGSAGIVRHCECFLQGLGMVVYRGTRHGGTLLLASGYALPTPPHPASRLCLRQSPS